MRQENDFYKINALVGFWGKIQPGLNLLCELGKLAKGIANGDWESDNAAQTLLIYYMIYKWLLYCNILQEIYGMNV